MRKFRILIVYPDPEGLSLLTSMLKSLGHVIEEAANDRVAVRLMERSEVNLVLASIDPEDADALELLSYSRRKHPHVPVVLLFPRVHPERAKEALRLGAMAVLKYPVPAAELRAAVLQALEQCESRPAEPSTTANTVPTSARARLQTAMMEAASAPGQVSAAADRNGAIGSPYSAVLTMLPPAAATGSTDQISSRAQDLAREINIIGEDPSLRQMVELAGALAKTRSTVLIVGEAGVGKAQLARLIHLGSGRPERPFIVLKAADLGEDSTAAEEGISFGSGKPTSEWATRISQARGGTLFIQEVGELSSETQLQLLRQLQLQDIEAATGHFTNDSRGDVRIILSSCVNLQPMVEQGGFRQDLYHRISSLCLMLPPLKLRGGDIETLAEHFRERFALEFRKTVLGFSRDALEALHRHDWPGNIRELQGVVQRAVALCSGPRITSSHLAPILNPHRQTRGSMANLPRPHLPAGIRPLKEALEEPEKRIIIQALQALNWNRQETARVLDINRTTLYKKMKKYGLLVDEPIWAN